MVTHNQKGLTLIEVIFALVIISAVAVFTSRVMQAQAEVNRLRFVTSEFHRLQHALEYHYLDFCLIEPFVVPTPSDLVGGGYLQPELELIPDIAGVNVFVENVRTSRASGLIRVLFNEQRMAGRFASREAHFEQVDDLTVEYRFLMPTVRNWRAVERREENLIMGSRSCY